MKYKKHYIYKMASNTANKYYYVVFLLSEGNTRHEVSSVKAANTRHEVSSVKAAKALINAAIEAARKAEAEWNAALLAPR